MNPEVIVRALAAGDEPTADSVLPQLCTLCDATYGPQYAAIVHEPSCPWRMAREWVAAQSQEPEGEPVGQPAGELQELADPKPVKRYTADAIGAAVTASREEREAHLLAVYNAAVNEHLTPTEILERFIN